MNDKQLSIELISDEGLAETDSAARVLWDELSSLRDVKVDAAKAAVPANAKSGDPGTISTLILTVLGSHGLAALLSGVLRDWLMRNKTFKIRVKRGKDVVEISGGKPSEAAAVLPEINKILRNN
jgi:hypothetical protein